MAYQSNLKYWDDFAKAEAQKQKKEMLDLPPKQLFFKGIKKHLGLLNPL